MHSWRGIDQGVLLCKVAIEFTLANNQIKRDKQLLGTHLGPGGCRVIGYLLSLLVNQWEDAIYFLTTEHATVSEFHKSNNTMKSNKYTKVHM